MARTTKADLEQRLLEMQPLTEYFYTTQNGDKGIVVKSTDPLDKRRDRYVVKYYGAARASGGVVVDGYAVHMMEDWSYNAERSSDPYRVELARKVRRLHREALDEKYGKR